MPHRLGLNRHSLRRTLIVGAAAGVVFPALIIHGTLLQSRYERDLRQSVLNPKKQTLDLLARSAATPMWTVDYTQLQDMANASIHHNSVVSIAILSEDGKVVAKAEDPERRRGHIQTEMRRIYPPSSTHEPRQPTSAATPIGTVTMEYTSYEAEKDFRSDMLQVFLALAAQAGISFGLIYLLVERRIVIPLRALRERAMQIARGKLSEPVTAARPDEIGHLAEGLEHMRTDLVALLDERDLKNKAMQDQLQAKLEAEQALNASQAKFLAIFDISPLPMVVARIDERSSLDDSSQSMTALDANEAFLQLAQIRRHEVASLKWSELFESVRELDETVRGLRLLHGVSRLECTLNAKGGGRSPICEVSGRAFSLGAERLCILMFEDVTERRTSEEAVLKLNAQLEHRVTERTEALARTNRELSDTLHHLQQAQAELMRSEKMAALGSLVADVTHELRSPIHHAQDVARQLDRLSEELLTRSPLTTEQLRDAIESVRDGSQSLKLDLGAASSLISSFRQVAMDQSSVQWRRFMLDRLVQDVATTLGPKIRRFDAELNVQVPPDLELGGYPGPLTQVIAQLVDNALQHAYEPGDRYVVDIKASRLDADHVILSVNDRGHGMAADTLNQLREDLSPQRSTRKGLGLQTVFSLVRGILGGQVTVASTAGLGTSFSITLPLNQVSQVSL